MAQELLHYLYEQHLIMQIINMICSLLLICQYCVIITKGPRPETGNFFVENRSTKKEKTQMSTFYDFKKQIEFPKINMKLNRIF